MEKKKILFVLIHAKIGGVEKSFLSLVQELYKSNQFEIDLFLFVHEGELLDEYKKVCNVLPEIKSLNMIGMTQKSAREKSRIYGTWRLIVGGIAKYISKSIAYGVLMRGTRLNKQYDCAISYLHNKPSSLYGGTNEFVLKHVNAYKKVSFIHCDLNSTGLNNTYDYKLYKQFDGVVNVSESCKKVFDEAWPDLLDKSYVVYNTCNVEEICKLASSEADVKYDDKFLNMVTVARLDKVKGIERTLKVLSSYRDISWRWYIVGDGPRISEIKERIREYRLSSKVFLTGEKKNPYPYIKNADMFLLPSYQEAAPVVFLESNCLGVPILTTDTLSAREFVDDNKLGRVCDNSEDGLRQMFQDVFADLSRAKEMKLQINVCNRNKEAVEQFYSILQ